MKQKTLAVFLMSLTLGILSAWAAAPIAIWDGEHTNLGSFSLTTDNGNTIGVDHSIAIEDGATGGVVYTGDNSSLNNSTFIIRGSGLDLSNAGNQYLLTLHQNILGGTNGDASYNKVGASLAANNDKVRGIWGNAYYGNDNYQVAQPFKTGNDIVINIQTSGGVFVYEIVTDSGTGDRTLVKRYGNTNLKASSTNYKGFSLGGIYEKSSSTLVTAEGWTIYKLAVFGSTLSEAEILAYTFPSETQIINVDTDTAVSAINQQIDTENYKATVVSVADGVKITVDEAFGNVSVSSEGSIMLSAESQPDESYFANVDFSGIKGGLLRSWLGPDVIGYNFCSDGYNTSYYYGGASNTSSALATGTWYANGQSVSGSAGVYSDGLTKLSWSAPSVWSEQAGISSGTFIQGYLDDNGGSPVVEVSALPFEKYDVIIYCSAGSEGAKFQAKYVNGQYYKWDDEKGETVVAEGAGDNWGSAKTSSTPVYGTNCIRINNLTGPLTIRGGQRNSTLGGGCISAIQIIPAEVEIDATEGFIPDATRLENIRKDYRDVTIKGSGENGATLDFGSTTATLTSHIVFDGGTHTVSYSNSGTANIVFANNPEKPVFETINGATVNLQSIDLSGWQGSATDKVPNSNILVRDGTTFICQPNAARSFYYQGRFTIEPGATLKSCYTHSNKMFRMNGGAVKGYEQLYVPASDAQTPGTAVIEGSEGNTGLNLASDETPGLGIYVGENSTLDFNIAISGVASAPTGKWGMGTLKLNGSMADYAGTLTIHEGVVAVSTATTLANVVNEAGATLAFAYGENGASLPTITSYSGSGTVQIDVSDLSPVTGVTYPLMPGIILDASTVKLIGLEDQNFHVDVTEDGVVLTESTIFSPIWTGGSGVWSATEFDGREGDTTDLAVWFAESAGNATVAVTVSGEKSVASLSFVASDTEYTLTGNKITASGAISVSGASPVAISTPIEANAVSLGADTSLTFSTTDLTIPDGGLSGSGTLILDPGAGNTYTMSGGNTEYTGEVVIKSGTVNMADKHAFGPFGRSSVVRVKNGAALSLAASSSIGGYSDATSRLVLEKGAIYTASQSISDKKMFPFYSLALEGNAVVQADEEVGITRFYNFDTSIALGTNTLTKTGAKAFYISSASITGTGMLYVMEGELYIETGYWASSPVTTCADGTIKIGKGTTLTLGDYGEAKGKLSVKNLILDGSVTAKAPAKNTITVTGNLSGSGTTPMLTLADGATLKPQSITEKLTVTDSLTLSGNINVDISDLDLTGKFKLPLITTPTQITAEQVALFNRGTNSENWQLYSEEVSTGTYEFGVKIESIPWTGESGVWTDTGFDGGDDNYLNDGSQKVVFMDDAFSSATPLEVTVDGEKNVDTLGFTADNRAVTITGDAITAGTVTKSGKGIATIKSALTVGTELALTDGILVLNPTEEAIDTAGMDDGTLVVYVAAGTTNTISVAITAAKLIKLGPGTLALGNANNISGGTLLEDGQIVSTVVPANNVAIAAGATFTLKDVQWVSGNRFSGEGTLELYLSSSTRNFGGSEALDLPGKLKVTRLGSGWPVFKGGFSTRSELEITEGTNAGLVMDVGYIGEGNAFQVKNLSGGGTINPQNGATGGNRFIDTLQTAPTEFKGNFMAGGTSGGGAERSAALIVRGDEHSYGLTLSGASTTKGDLIITDNGKVIFSETGSWANGAITVNDSGCLEVRNSAAMTSATLTLNDGATVVIPLVEEAIVPLAATTINASGNVYVDLTKTGITPTSDPITVMTGYVGEDVSGLRPVGCTGKFSLEEGSVIFTPSQAEPWTGGSATWKSDRIVSSDESASIDYADLAAVAFGAIGDPATEATITIEGTRTPESITFNGGEGKTYKLTGGALRPEGVMTIAGGTVVVNTEAVLSEVVGDGELAIGDDGVVAITSASSISADTALSGTGTLILDGFLPDAPLLEKLSDAAWQGTLWLKNIGDTGTGETSAVAVVLESLAGYGNANSCVKFTNVRAYAGSADCPWTLVLEDDSENGYYAWYDNNGDSADEIKIAKLKGTGTLYDAGNSARRERITFTDVSEFAGSISTTGKRIGLGGTTELDASNAGSIEVVAEKTLAIAAGKGLAATRVLIAGTVEMTASSLMLGEVAGTGTIRCAALLNVAPTFGADWTGSVELPVVAAEGLNLNRYGRSGSKVVVKGITGGYLHAEAGYQVAPDMELQGDMLITDASVRAYTFQTISGPGNFVFDTEAAITSIAIARIAADYTGTVTNNTSATLSIGEIALAATPVEEAVVLAAGGAGAIANTRATADGATYYTIFQDADDRNLYMAVMSLTQDSTTTYYKTAQAALNTLNGAATLAGMVPEPPFTWDTLTGLAVPDAVTSIDMVGIRDFANWSFDVGTSIAVRPTLAEVVAGEIAVTNVPDGIAGIAVYTYGSDDNFGTITISGHNGSLTINTEVLGVYSTYLNDSATPDAKSANASWQSFNLRNAVTEPDSVHFLFADAATDIAEITEVVKLSSIMVYWGSGTDVNANFGGSGDVAITTKPYLVVTTSDNVIVAISAEGDSEWVASGSTTFAFNHDLLASSIRYRFQFAESVAGLAVGETFSAAKIARCNCRWHASGQIAEEDTCCSGNNTCSINAQITVGIVRTVNYRKTIDHDVNWSAEKPEGWEDGAAPYIAITAAEDSTPTFTFNTDVTAGVLTVDGAVTVKKDANATLTFGSIVAKNGATLYNLGSTPVSVTEGTVTLFDWATASVASPGAGAAIRYAGTSTLTSLPFVTDSVNVQGGIILAQPFANELFQPVGSKALVGFEAGADVTVTRMVLGNQGGVVQNFRQTGGTVTITGDGSVSGNANQTAPLLIGHWNSTVVYDMVGGLINLPNGAVRLAWGNSNDSSGSATWNIGGGEGEATVNTKGIRAGSERSYMPGTINLKPNGVLTLRDGGIQFLSQNATLNLMGGKIVAAADMEIANAKANGTVLAADTETVIDTGANTVTLSAALTGSGTLVKQGSGTLLVSGSIGNIVGKIRVEGGALNMGSTRDLSKVEAGAGITQLQVNQTQLEYLNGVTEITNVPSGITSLLVNKFNGETAFAEPIGSNTWRLVENVPTGGVAALYDFTFDLDHYVDNTDPDYSGSGKNQVRNLGSAGGTITIGTGTAVEALDPDTGNLFAWRRPVIQALSYPSEYTAAVYCTMPTNAYNVLIAFGSTADGYIALTRGEGLNDARLIYVGAGATNPRELAVMRAKAATETKHLYVFTKTADTISVYLDGRLVITKSIDGLAVGNALQIGRAYGGNPDIANWTSVIGNNDPSRIEVIRIYGEVISDEVMAALVGECPFEDVMTASTRTLEAADGTNTWYSAEVGAWDNTPADDGHMPPLNANVTLNVEGEVPQWMSVILNTSTYDGKNEIGDLHITGSQALTIRKSIGGQPVSISGVLTNDVELTIHYGALDMAAVPLYMGEQGSIVFDLTELVDSKRDTEPVYLTGVCGEHFYNDEVGYDRVKCVNYSSNNLIQLDNFDWDSATHRYRATFTASRGNKEVYFEPVEGGADNLFNKDSAVYYLQDETRVPTYIIAGDTLCFLVDEAATVMIATNDEMVAVAGYKIPDGVTVVFNEDLTVPVEGAGTIVMNKCKPQVTIDAVKNSLQDSAKWTGTLAIERVEFGNTSLSKLGNANSTIRLAGCSIYPQASYEVAATLEIDNSTYGYGLHLRGVSAGGDTAQEIVFDKLAGSGLLMNIADEEVTTHHYLRIKDASEFSGPITNDAVGVTMLFGTGEATEGSVVITAGTDIDKALNLRSSMCAATNLIVRSNLIVGEKDVRITADSVDFGTGGTIALTGEDLYPTFIVQSQITGTIYVSLENFANLLAADDITVLRVNKAEYLPKPPIANVQRAPGAAQDYTLVIDADGKGYSLVNEGFYIRIR